MAKVLFLHGLESGPHGSKYRALVEEFGEGVLAPDCEGVYDVDARYALVEEATRGERDLLVVGSSFGGLMASLLASEHPERVAACILMAPALHDKWPEAVAKINKVPERTVIIHGLDDDVVPMTASRAHAAKHGVRLLEVADDHRLKKHAHLMVRVARRMADELG